MNSHFVQNKHEVLLKLILMTLIISFIFVSSLLVWDVRANRDIVAIGDIEVYDSDGVTTLTTYHFPLFIGSKANTFGKQFFINNTGTQPVAVYWQITSSSITWELGVGLYCDEYVHHEDAETKYSFGITKHITPSPNTWMPDREALILNVDEGICLSFTLHYCGKPATAERFRLTTTFVAEPVELPPIPVMINFAPKSLKLNSPGNWLLCAIQLPYGYDEGDIDFASIQLNDTIPADLLAPMTGAGHSNNGRRNVIIGFDRTRVNDWLINIGWPSTLRNKQTAILRVTGIVRETVFEGLQLIRLATQLTRNLEQ